MYIYCMKPIVFLGRSLSLLRTFPDAARREAGYQLDGVQRGASPSDWKPMSNIGPGVREIRVRIGGAWRVVYVANRAEAVYVLHAFQKKAEQTSRQDINAIKTALKELK